jgi:YkoY family integral membrane protein
MDLGKDLALVGFLVFIEGILSIDNALVLAMMAKHLPPAQQKKALSYGLLGAVVFRLLAIVVATHVIRFRWVKFAGGAYLIYVALHHFLSRKHGEAEREPKRRDFWRTVVMIELLDIAFAVDSILAAVALTRKVWIVFTGGFLGVILIRFAASGFLKVLNRFPGFERTAYLLIVLIGTKIILEGLEIPALDFHTASSPAFIAFWSLMFLCVVSGFRTGTKQKPHSHSASGS